MSTRTAHLREQKQHPATLVSSNANVALLLRRSGFGTTQPQIDQAANQGLAATIGRLVDYQQTPDNFVPPDPSLLNIGRTQQIDPLTEWWLERMLATSRPLQEKMTLFWHGHFATSNYKVAYPSLMYRQNQLFRTNALGRFDDLLTGVYKDPAMLIWLDGRVNTAVAPNENWGREVLELFTLGPGNYTEDDIHANARAFTGWRLDANLQPVFAPRQHDNGSKTFLGQTGNWSADDDVRIMAAHPATGPFLATKLWKFFASGTPSAPATNRMASTYYSSNHSIREMVRVMFGSPEFYAADTRQAYVKSPVEFLVATLIQLGVTNPSLTGFARLLTQLGQQLFNPPNVGGWSGGVSWINGGTMLDRFNASARFTGQAPGSKPLFDGQAILQQANPVTAQQLIGFIADMLGISLTRETASAVRQFIGAGSLSVPSNLDPADAIDLTAAAAQIYGMIHLFLVSPEYQIA